MTFAALDSALLGPLFASDAMRACFSDQAWLGSMLQVEAALARAEASLGLVPGALAGAVEAIAPDDLDPVAIGRATAVAGVPTIPFLKAVQTRLPTELEPGLHKGATTQDLLDTALVLRLREALGLVARDLDAILAGLARLAEQGRAMPCAGRTYGQQAAPITFGFAAAVWLAGVAEAAERLADLRPNLLVASLGGPVGTLAGLGAQGPAVLEAFAGVLGLGAPPIAWHARRGRITAAGAWLVELLGSLAKLATDVAHLASTELGEVSEAYVPGRGGSSAMPHKRNPVSSTVILAAFAVGKGLLLPLLDAMAALHQRPAGPWHAEWHALPSLFGLASGALREARALAEGLVVHPERMRDNLEATRGLLFADAAAVRLGAHLGREAAHALIEHAAGRVRETGETLRTVLDRDPGVPEAARPELARAFDLGPAVTAAGPWIDRALADAARVRARLAGLYATQKDGVAYSVRPSTAIVTSTR